MTDEPKAIMVRPNVLPSTAQFAMMRELAERLAYAEGFIPDHFFRGDPRTRPHRVLAAIEYGRAVGIEPMIALQNITLINGRAGASALLIGALLRKAGYEPQPAIYSENDQKCTVDITRNGKLVSSGVYSLTDAKRAGLIRPGGGWEKNPRDMLYARALTQAARQGAQDAVLGIGMSYTAEELGVETDGDGEVTGEIKGSAESQEFLEGQQNSDQRRMDIAAAAVTSAVPLGDPAPKAPADAEVLAPGASAGSPPPPTPQEILDKARKRGRPKGSKNRVEAGDTQGRVTMDMGLHSAVASPRQEDKGNLSPQASRSVATASTLPFDSQPPKGWSEAAAQGQAALDALDAEREVYLVSLRAQAREAAAQLKVALARRKGEAEPPSEPNPESDEALRLLIARSHAYPDLGELNADTLDGLNEQSLALVIGWLENRAKP